MVAIEGKGLYVHNLMLQSFIIIVGKIAFLVQE